jgi:hypothetical protein
MYTCTMHVRNVRVEMESRAYEWVGSEKTSLLLGCVGEGSLNEIL